MRSRRRGPAHHVREPLSTSILSVMPLAIGVGHSYRACASHDVAIPSIFGRHVSARAGALDIAPDHLHARVRRVIFADSSQLDTNAHTHVVEATVAKRDNVLDHDIRRPDDVNASWRCDRELGPP